MDRPIWDSLDARGAAPALHVPGREPVSYAELHERARRFAEHLGSGRRLVAIEAAASDHVVVAYVGALLGGHAVALIPPEDTRSREAFAARFAPDATYRRVGGRWRLDMATRPGPMVHPDLALLMVTSGSTGCGKAVRLSRRAVHANALAIADYLGLTPDDRAALVLPLHYSYGLSVLNSHLAVGGSVDLGVGSVMVPGFLERIGDGGCTSLAGVPYTFELLEHVGFRDRIPPQLRLVTSAGGRLAPDLVVAYDAALRARGGRFYAMYGQTEATARIAYLPPERAATAPDRIGVAIPGGQLSLLDEAGHPVTGAGATGELAYCGPNVMMGYAETRDDLARGPEVDLLRTGDLAEVDEDGLYRVVGRLARFSKIAGIRVGHDAVEAALARRGVDAAVVGDDAGLLVAHPDRHASDDVRRLASTAAGLTLRHVRTVAVPELPRLPSGKIDLAAVRRLADRAATGNEAIAEAFRDAFFPHPVRPGDSFASLAGDSLRFVELSAALEARLGAVPEGWERMSVAELSALEQNDRTGHSWIGTDLVIRAAAILMVVVQHATLWPVPGGAAAMMVLIGFGLARFQLPALVAGDRERFLRPLLSVLLPYYAILAGHALAWGEVPWASVLLVGNLGVADPIHHTMLPYLYWFVEAYVQIMLLLVCLFAIGPIRRIAATRPFALAMAFLCGALVLRAVVPAVWPLGGRQIFTPAWVLHLCAFGWCAALADTARRRAIVLGAALAAMPVIAWAGGNWVGSWIKFGLQVPVIAALLYRPRVRLPSWAASVVLAIAAASFSIYLVHRFVPEFVLAGIEGLLPPAVFTGVSIVGGVLLGLAAHRLQREARTAAAMRQAQRPGAATSRLTRAAARST